MNALVAADLLNAHPKDATTVAASFRRPLGLVAASPNAPTAMNVASNLNADPVSAEAACASRSTATLWRAVPPGLSAVNVATTSNASPVIAGRAFVRSATAGASALDVVDSVRDVVQVANVVAVDVLLDDASHLHPRLLTDVSVGVVAAGAAAIAGMAPFVEGLDVSALAVV